MSSSDDTAANKLESICTGCGERNPPHFALCWNCSASLENAEKAAAVEEPDEDDANQIQTVASDNPFGRWTGWYELIAVLLLAFVDRFVILLVYYGWNRSRDVTFDSVAYLTYLPYYIGLSMLLWTLVRRDREIKQPLALSKCNWWIEIAFALAIVFANMVIVRFVGAFAFQIGASAAKKAHETITHTAITGVDQWVVSLVYWFCVALFEEFLYRVYLQSKFESLLRNTPLAILLSAALFAISHGYPWPGTLRVFATGVLFGTIYSCSHRVPRLVLAHWMYDLLVVFLQQH
jgi:membrane protease YdiL (CAAX protease family)